MVQFWSLFILLDTAETYDNAEVVTTLFLALGSLGNNEILFDITMNINSFSYTYPSSR